MADEGINRDSLISQFCEVTGTDPREAEQHLSINSWDFSSAITEYYASQDNGGAGSDVEDVAPPSRRPRTLGGAPAPASTSGTSTPSSAVNKGKALGKFATLGDFTSGERHSHSGDDSDEDYEDDGKKQDLYAGGEKSGIALHNPNDPRSGRVKGLAEKLVKKATEEARRGGLRSEEPQINRFTGIGMTLGSDDTPSQSIPDPNAQTTGRATPLERTLTFWRDGFSVDDGPLMRFDDPANERYLRDIRLGQAPRELLNVEHDQETDVRVYKRMTEDYVPPKSKGPFRGGGQRLGSPTPGPGTRSQATAPIPTTASSSATMSTPTMDVDASQPTVSLQIRLGDGSRLVSRFNTTHTVGDVRSFVFRASPQSLARSWVLMTTFPSKELRDEQVTLGSIAEFKRGGVVVQKWE
ncbi:MAG: NSFL1 cofactor p47 [Geoglossum simile]|nr:MAG: NSFL1 cofactor p47 [Geoglossum simile]